MSETSSTLRKRFTPEEDNALRHVVHDLGIRNWEAVAASIPGRTARQCRDRYNNYLFKEISTSTFTPEEDAIVLQKYAEIGPHWVAISKFLNGRSGNNVKNRWYKFLSKVCVCDTTGNVSTQKLKSTPSAPIRKPSQTPKCSTFSSQPLSFPAPIPVPQPPSQPYYNMSPIPMSQPQSLPTYIPKPTINRALPSIKLNNVSRLPNQTSSENPLQNPETWINDEMEDLLEIDWENLIDFKQNSLYL